MLKGIDISNYQPSVDFNALKNSVQVVIMKATEGTTYLDPKLESHYQGAKAAGFPVGFYHFMSEKTSPSEQATFFYNAIKDKQFEINTVLDIETNSQNRTAYQITDRCLEFLAKFKELSGLDCIIYTGGYFGRDNLDNRIKAYKAWIAHYGVNSPMETGFYNVVGHQYTSSGSVYGINGNVDLNNFTDGIFINRNIEIPKEDTKTQQVENRYGIVTATVLNVRDGAGINYSVIGQLKNGSRIRLGPKVGSWYNIYFGNHGGWVSSEYVSLESSQIVEAIPQKSGTYGEVTASVLNVRSGAGTNYKIIGKLQNGEKVRLDVKLGNWWSIYYGDHGGFVSGDYIKPL